jgi:hypothetical protein
MLDVEIIKFYDSVKDPTWPDIFSYTDSQQLPNFIKQECDQLHRFQSRKEQICSADYWIDITADVCVYKNLAFVPVGKCGLFYHTGLFGQMGWKKTPLRDVDVENTNFFGIVMHPLQRRLKGITQWLLECYRKNERTVHPDNPWVTSPAVVDWEQLNTDLENKYIRQLISTVQIGDRHSTSYHLSFGEFLNKVNWIPLDTLTDDQVKISMMSFFNRNGHTIQLPLNDQRRHVSGVDQLRIFNLVKQEFYNNPDNLISFYKIYGNDLKFYYNLVDNFSPDWQHL